MNDQATMGSIAGDPLHVLTTDHLRTNHRFEVLAADGALIGFCYVVADNPNVILEIFWLRRT